MVAAAAAVAAADVAVAAADVAVAAADASAAAAVAQGAVMPIVADPVRGAAKLTAVDDDEADGLCRRVCRERCLGLHSPVEPRGRAPPPRGLTPEARAWVQPVPPLLVRVSSTRTRASPSSSGSVSVINKNILFSTSKSEGRPFRMRRLISFLVVLTSFCYSFIIEAFPLAMYSLVDSFPTSKDNSSNSFFTLS